ncbi:hypothetical protein CEXT_383591 [Caerostris extrusa]|uniref:Uncharacterized protein n=1 Tax=Caerostris extrusa TaxID=172846 RepID=A0AAV4MRF7_CAEEX|nr:hypothetical protein CEXT_383591 [Caerostris extrusa]
MGDSLQKPVAPIRVESARQQNKHGYRPTDKCPPPHAPAHTDSASVRLLKNDSPSKGSQKYTKTLLHHEIIPSRRETAFLQVFITSLFAPTHSAGHGIKYRNVNGDTLPSNDAVFTLDIFGGDALGRTKRYTKFGSAAVKVATSDLCDLPSDHKPRFGRRTRGRIITTRTKNMGRWIVCSSRLPIGKEHRKCSFGIKVHRFLSADWIKEFPGASFAAERRNKVLPVQREQLDSCSTSTVHLAVGGNFGNYLDPEISSSPDIFCVNTPCISVVTVKERIKDSKKQPVICREVSLSGKEHASVLTRRNARKWTLRLKLSKQSDVFLSHGHPLSFQNYTFKTHTENTRGKCKSQTKFFTLGRSPDESNAWQKSAKSSYAKAEESILSAMKIIYFQAKEDLGIQKFSALKDLVIDFGCSCLAYVNANSNFSYDSEALASVIQEKITRQIKRGGIPSWQMNVPMSKWNKVSLFMLNF